MGKIDFSVGEFDTRVQFYKQEITQTDAGAIVKDFIKTTEAFAGVSSKTLDETVGGGTDPGCRSIGTYVLFIGRYE